MDGNKNPNSSLGNIKIGREESRGEGFRVLPEERRFLASLDAAAAEDRMGVAEAILFVPPNPNSYRAHVGWILGV